MPVARWSCRYSCMWRRAEIPVDGAYRPAVCRVPWRRGPVRAGCAARYRGLALAARASGEGDQGHRALASGDGMGGVADLRKIEPPRSRCRPHAAASGSGSPPYRRAPRPASPAQKYPSTSAKLRPASSSAARFSPHAIAPRTCPAHGAGDVHRRPPIGQSVSRHVCLHPPAGPAPRDAGRGWAGTCYFGCCPCGLACTLGVTALVGVGNPMFRDRGDMGINGVLTRLIRVSNVWRKSSVSMSNTVMKRHGCGPAFSCSCSSSKRCPALNPARPARREDAGSHTIHRTDLPCPRSGW